MNEQECLNILQDLYAEIEPLRHADVSDKDVQIKIARTFIRAAAKISEEDSPKIKDWLENCSGALDWHGMYDSRGRFDQYRSYLNKNVHLLRRIIGQTSP